MYVCVCHGVTDKDIVKAIDGGIHTMEGLSNELMVGTCCGRCSDCAREVLNESLPLSSSVPFSTNLAA